MGRSSKSRRFVQHGVNQVSQHDKRFPYFTTYAEAEVQKMRNSKPSETGGF